MNWMSMLKTALIALVAVAAANRVAPVSKIING